jgi:hypothetical protein
MMFLLVPAHRVGALMTVTPIVAAISYRVSQIDSNHAESTNFAIDDA